MERTTDSSDLATRFQTDVARLSLSTRLRKQLLLNYFEDVLFRFPQNVTIFAGVRTVRKVSTG
ncbi:hypothetical protein [Parabacteroides sp. ZJ-118]|uniref:hypothetical protein n=1 Tax=Parabacteroides sp. ZJ-118 TaxID=2709398 RepID=UPI0013E9BF0F|nr:hypothetical protein [Parabacteroides sp. ZJ-118]